MAESRLLTASIARDERRFADDEDRTRRAVDGGQTT